jgi:hypothetical protein
MVKIQPFIQHNQDAIAAGSYIRFNAHFRNIRTLVFYPTAQGDQITMTNSAPASNGDGDAFMSDEAGVRIAMSSRSCRSFNDEEYKDAAPQSRDDLLERLLPNSDAMRTQGSIISFGMVVKNKIMKGYEFCQLELAATDGDDRVLIVGIKIPDVEKVSSLCIKEQVLLPHMHKLAEHRFLEVDKGLFTIREYGTPSEERRGTLIPQLREYSTLDLGAGTDQERLDQYTRLVGKACLESSGRLFNAAVFEEWRNSVPSLTVDQHLRNLYQLYTHESQLVAEELEQLRPMPRDVRNADNDRFEDMKGTSKEIDKLRQSLYLMWDAQTYIVERKGGLEFQRVQEHKFRLNNGKEMKATIGETTPRASTPDESGSTTPTNSPRRAIVKAERDSENEALKQILLSFIANTEKAAAKGTLKNNSSPADEATRRRLEEEEDLRQTLLMVMRGDNEETPHIPQASGSVKMKSAKVKRGDAPQLPVRLSKPRAMKGELSKERQPKNDLQPDRKSTTGTFAGSLDPEERRLSSDDDDSSESGRTISSPDRAGSV